MMRSSARRAAYPRVCGATAFPVALLDVGSGLSPRVRGNLGLCVMLLGPLGPIPACAGQPESAAEARPQTRAYPRVCGATISSKNFPGIECGLSPRVRGNRIHRLPPKGWAGPIPACAGQPEGFVPTAQSAGAYPRVCGATCSMRINPAGAEGLSPRVRGNPPAQVRKLLRAGPIPACAGQPLT